MQSCNTCHTLWTCMIGHVSTLSWNPMSNPGSPLGRPWVDATLTLPVPNSSSNRQLRTVPIDRPSQIGNHWVGSQFQTWSVVSFFLRTRWLQSVPLAMESMGHCQDPPPTMVSDRSWLWLKMSSWLKFPLAFGSRPLLTLGLSPLCGARH